MALIWEGILYVVSSLYKRMMERSLFGKYRKIFRITTDFRHNALNNAPLQVAAS